MARTVLQKEGAFDADLRNAINAMFAELYAGANTGGTTTINVGAAEANVTAVENGNGIFHQTVLTITALPIALSDAHVGGGSKIYTFPKGNITITGATASVAETTTSAILTTLNGGKTLSAGVGSVQTTTQDSGTLATTQQDLVSAFAPVSSTVINVAAAAAVGSNTATTAPKFDGSVTALAAFLNCGIPTATDIDGDATSTWTGTVTINWQYNGTGL